MDMKFVLQTTILSTRWKHLWKSSPTLNFHLDYSTCKQNPASRSSRWCITSIQNHNTKVVDRVFHLREACGIQKLSLSSFRRIKAGHIFTWLYAAKARNVQELHLSLLLDGYDPLELVQDFVTTVRVLSLQGFPLPGWVCSAKLITSLKLVSVRLPDGDSNGHLNFSCPVLENLIVTFCRTTHLKMLMVSTPLLKNLELNTAITCKTNICCPNLTMFKCSSIVRGTLSFQESQSSLISANIDISPCDGTETGITSYDYCSRNVLDGISNVKSLTLGDNFLKTMLIDHTDVLERVPNLFHNLRYMLVKDWDRSVCIHTLANILKRLPCIENLVWGRNPGSCSLSKEESQVVDISSEGVLRYLKTFEIRNLQVDMDELTFVKFLLGSAIVLKKMILVITSADFAECSKLGEFKEKVLSLPRASSSLSVSFYSGPECSPYPTRHD